MKVLFCILMLASTISAQAGGGLAIVIKDDSTASVEYITYSTENMMLSVNADNYEDPNGTYTAFKQVLLTGVFVYKNNVMYIYPKEDASLLMVNTNYMGGIVCGLYSPLTPKHIIR